MDATIRKRTRPLVADTSCDQQSSLRANPLGQSSTSTSVPSRSTASVSPDLPEALQLKIEMIAVDDLRAAARRTRSHSDKQISKIASSIRRFGFLCPLLVDDDGTIVAGHGRLEAARLIGMTTVPVIRISHLDEPERRAYAIADNRLAELAGWDEELLRLEVIDLQALDLDLLDFTGFETPELDLIIDGPVIKREKADPADQLPDLEKVAVSRTGDIWALGGHRILCGDARRREDYQALMGEEKAAIVFSDPPYNVRIDGHVSGLGKVRHREFAVASGEMSKPEFIAFLTAVFQLQYDFAADGSLHFTCIDWAHLHEMLEAGHAVYDALKNIIVWSKTNAGMGSLYRSQHEVIPLWKKGTSPHVNNIQLGSTGRYRTNVWTYAGANTFRRGRMEDLAAHPTVKPTALVVDALKDCSKIGDVVLDPFGGSGTTLIAAEKARRRARLIEFDPLYVDLTIRRFAKLTQAKVFLVETGESFEEVAARRIGEACHA